MSAWGGYYSQITIPAGGWTFAASDSGGRFSTVLASGTADCALSLMADLATGLETGGDIEYTAKVRGGASFGKFYLSTSGEFTSVPGNCSAALLSTIGMSTTDVVDSGNLYFSNRPMYVWWPGLITFGATQGAGLAGDTGWVPDDTAIGSVSGSGQGRCIELSRQIHRRVHRYAKIKRAEREDPYRGAALLERYARTKKLRWYKDRDGPTPSAQGTQQDPEDEPRDKAATAPTAYWLVTQNAKPRIERSPEHPDWFSVELDLNGEPD